MSDHFFPRFCSEFKKLNPRPYSIGMTRVPPILALIRSIPNEFVGGDYFLLCQIVGENGSAAALKALLAEVIDRDFVNTPQLTTGFTMLHYAADAGTPKMVRALLQCGANIEARGRNGSSALHVAAFAGNTEIVGVLLEHGAQVNAQDNLGNTPLHGAVEGGHLYTVIELLEGGAWEDVPNVKRARPTQLAVANDYLAIFLELLKAGADVTQIVKVLE